MPARSVKPRRGARRPARTWRPRSRAPGRKSTRRSASGGWRALGGGAGGAGHAKGSDAPPRPITVSAAEQARLGVLTQALTAAPAPAGLASTARVLDPGPLIQLDADLAAASASLAASRA